MNKINMNGFGMPKSGVEVMQEQMFGGMSLENGPQLPELDMPEFGNVAEEPVRMGGTKKMVDTVKGLMGEDAERNWRMRGLQSLVLYDKDEYFRENVGKHPELGYLTPDRVRADKKGFNMLLGAELSQAIGNGDTYGALQVTINALPKEKQLGAKGRVQQCETEYQAQELLGELWSEVMVTGYDEKKTELEAEAAKKKERAAAALGEVNKWLDAGWVERVKSGVGGAPLSDWTKAEAVQSGAMTAEQVAELDETTARAQQAFELLMVTMHDGRTYVGHRLDVSHAAEARKKELAKDWSFAGDGETISDAEIWQQTAHEMSSKYRLSRADIVKLLDCMRRPDGTIDETALALFAAACHDVAYGEQAILSSDFWGNFVGALGDWGSETVDYFDRSFTQAEALTSLTNYKEAQKRLDTEFSADVEKMKGMFAEVEAIRRTPDERMPWVLATWTKTGETVGASTPFLIASAINPALGYATLYPSTTNAQIASNYYHGVANPVAMAHITGTWQTLAEGLFGKAVMKIPGVGKLMDWVGLKTVSVPLIGKAVGKVQGNAFLRIATGMGMETAGELVVEDLVASIGEWGTVKLVNALGGDLPEQELNLLDNAWKNMQDSSQTGATAAYCVALGLLGVPANMQAARDFASSRQFLLQAGLTEGGVAEVQAAHTEYSISVAKALELERFRLSKVRAEAGDKAVEEAENKAGRPLEGVEANKIRTEAGEKAVAEEVEKIKTAHQGKLNETMRRVYDRDVLREDPVALKKRMEKRGEKFLEEVEVGLYAASGVRDAVLAEAGVTVGEKTKDGKRKVQFKGEKEGEVKEVEWTDEQLNAYVAMQRESGMIKRMRDFQTRVAGTALAEAEVTDASVKHELINLRALPARALARMQRNGGQIDYAVMQDLAEDAAEKISGFVAGGMSAGEARAQMSELPGVTLGALAQNANAFVQRVEELAGTAEGRALGINRVEDAVTNVFRMNRANAPGQSVILYNRGLASEREVVEDLLEGDVVAAVEGEHASTSWEALEGMLRRVEGEMMKHGGGRLFSSKEKASKMAIIEAFSKLGQSYFLLNHGKYQMSAEAHGTIEYVQKKMADAQHLVAMSHAWEAFAKSKDGKAFLKKEGASFEKLLSDAGASVAGHYAAAKFDAAKFAAVKEAYAATALPSTKLAEETLDAYVAEQAKAVEPAAKEIPAEESITGEKIPLEQEVEPEVSTVTEAAAHDEKWQRMHDAEQRMRDGKPTAVDVAYYMRESGLTLAEAETMGLVGRGQSGELTAAFNIGMTLAEKASATTMNALVEGKVGVKEAYLAVTAAASQSGQEVALQALAEGKSVEYATALVRRAEKLAGQEDVAELMAKDAEFKKDAEGYAAEVAERREKLQAGIKKAETVEAAAGLAKRDAALEGANEGSFSIIGPKALTWSKYTDLAFKGRKDGKMRAELDTSQAMLLLPEYDGSNGDIFSDKAYYLGDILDYAELYEAYPQLREMLVSFKELDPTFAALFYDQTNYGTAYIEFNSSLASYGEKFMRATLLHEIQHAIQEIEGYAGGYTSYTDDYFDMAEFMQNEGELEALNVERRMEMSKHERANSHFYSSIDEGEVSYSLASAEMEDIKAAAVADGTFMKAPNGKPSNLNERQWLQVRTTAFKEWFGDWEKVAVFNAAIEKLSSMNEVATISGNEFAPDGRKLTDKVTEFWNKEYGGIAKNPLLGDVTLDTRSVKASIAHGVGRLKSAAFAVVHDVIEQGVLVEIAPNWKGRGEDSYVIAAPVQIGDEAYVCEVVVMKGERRTGFYLHEVQIKEKLLDVFKTGVVTGTSGASKSILLDVWQRVKQIEENCSKIVDENGEPKVVTHATNSEPFTVFKRGERAGLSGKGIYFSPDGVGIWGKNVMRCFLNVRNPLTKENAPREVNNGGMSAVDPDVFEHFPQFDGVMLRRDEITVRDPNQIKSATDNRGTFDRGNADITFSIAMEIQDNLLKQEFSSKNTSINKTKAPAVFAAVEKKLGGWKSGTVNVDIGGGRYDTLTEKLAEKGVTNFIYEPFGRTIAHNEYILGQLRDRTTLGDTATCSNVLNVIKEGVIRANVIHQVAKAIKPDGVAYFTIYEGDKTGAGKVTNDDCWQENRKTATYVDEVKQYFGDVELKGGVIVARTPLHVNEPAIWKLGSDSETDSVTFSLGANLAAVHTLSANKLQQALELGGLPMPSVAITRLDKPYGWGGAHSINLVGRRELVDPKRGTDVYTADAWTGKFPRVTKKRANREDFEATMKHAGKLQELYGNVFLSIRGRFEQRLDADELRASLESDDGKALFAATQGHLPKPKMKDMKSNHPYFDKQFAKEVRDMWDGDRVKAGQEGAFADAVEAAFERWVARFDAKWQGLYRKLYAEDIAQLRGDKVALVQWDMRRSFNSIGRKELDTKRNVEALLKYAEGHKRAYRAWVAEKVEKWLSKESYIVENGKEATLDNVLAYMRKNKGLNKEVFSGYTPGMLRAARAAKVRTVADIQARREQLTDSKTSEEMKQKTEDLLRAFTRVVRERMSGVSDDAFYASDYALEALGNVKGKPSVEKVQAGLRKVFGYRPVLLNALLADEELQALGVEALDAMEAELEDYMEAVPNRAVFFDEFEYAVMPESMKQNKVLMKGLRDNGIKPVFHNGTMEGRDAALAGLREVNGVSFSIAAKAADLRRDRVELNATTAKDPEARAYMRMVMTNPRRFSGALTDAEVDSLFAIMDGIVAEVETMEGNYPVMAAWNKRVADRFSNNNGALLPKLSSFKQNGDYMFNIDLGTLCAKRESLDWLAQVMAEEGRLVNLGPTQIERLKDLLKSYGLATACDVCFVEAKRYRMLQDSVKTSFYWRAVCEAVGIKDAAPVGTPRELTAEQQKRLKEMADNDGFNDAYRKYVDVQKQRVEDYDLGLTPHMMNKLAKLFLEDSSLMGELDPYRLMTTAGVDELLRTYAGHTNLPATLAGMYGSSTAKPLEGFNVYDALSWLKSFDNTALAKNMEVIYALGGGRAQSFTDFSPVLFLDYVQMIADFEARALPMHVYTKVPAFVKLFGRTGIMTNMSFVPEMVEGVDADHAGLKKDENGNWVYAWSKDSFPVNEAYELREREDFGGRVGIIAVGVSDAHINMMLDDPRIDMVIPYHASGMPVLVKNKTGLRNATDYTDVQTTRPVEGGKRKADWSYNEALQRLKDPKKAAKEYLDYCKKNKFIPKFAQFAKHENYYKLLEDFRGYDNNGKAVLQGAVRLKLPENWQQELQVALEYRQKLQDKFETLEKDEEFLNKAREILRYQPLDGKVREVLMTRLNSALPGRNSVRSLSQSAFLDKLEEVLAEEGTAEDAKARVEVYRKGDGVIYGFAHGGTIYLNENNTNANTPAHEFTHVWAKVAQSVNAPLWKKGVTLLKKTKEWKEVMSDRLYENIRGDENAVASEVLARLAGKENEAFVRMLVDPDSKPLEKKGVIAKVYEWLREMWNSVRSIFDDVEGTRLTLQEFSRMPIKDLWDATRNRQFAKSARKVLGKKAEQVRAEMQAEHNEAMSFALSGKSMIDAAPLGKMAGEEKMQRLLNYAKKEAARWTRTFGKDTPNARAAEAMGTVSSILASIHKELPPKFRPRLDVNMRYVEVYARLLESGKVRAYGKLKKEERAAVEAELLDALREAKAKAEEEYERAKQEALDAAELTGEMEAMEAAEQMDVDDEVKRAAYLDRLAKRTAAATRKRLLAEAEAKKQQLEADIDALTREFAAEKLAQIASRMLNDAANSVEEYLIEETLGTVDALMERLAPRKLPNGKYDKGRMSADAYRKFVGYVQLMNKSKAEVAEKMEQLGREIAAEEAKSEDEREDNGAKLDALTEELAAWSTYGGLRGKNLEGVRKGVEALSNFAVWEKNVWSSMLQLQRNRAKRQALIAAEGLGGADEFKVKEATEKQGTLVQRLKDLGAGLMSLGQMFYGLGGVPKMRALVDESLDALSQGHVALAAREKRAFGQLADYMGEAMGLKTERHRNNFMAELKKKHKTNIYREGELVRHRLKLTLDEAAVWLEMTKAERDAKRAELDAAADKQGVLAENVPYEEDIPLIRAELQKMQEEESTAKYVKTMREFRKEAPKEPMVLSKDEALNILLLCEQADYIEAAHDNGYTDEVLVKLTEFVGSDVLGFGYAMREVLENNGLAEVYEAREGVPFPKVENYWPGNFDQSSRVNEQANALDPTAGGGTRYGMLITRVKHKLKFNLMGASNVFMAALAQQNNYICMGELTAKWRRLLSHNDFAMALKQHLGVAQFKQFKELIDLLDGAGVAESITQQTLSGLIGQFQSAHAMAVLAGSPITLIKQLSAMMNAGAWEGISMGRVLARIVLDRFGGGAIKYGDMLQKDYFKARCKDNRYFTEMLQLGRDANWSVLSSWARGAMGWIEKMDVLTNCASMTALYNITYHDLKKRNEGAADAMTEEEMHAECDRVVRNTLELGAQPLRRTQKSAFGALSRNALVKATCYMGSEALNKMGMALSLKRRTEGGGIKRFVKAWKYIAGISIAQQIVVMLLDIARNADPVDEDEWAEWLLLNLATGASGLGLLQSVPVLGEAVQKLTGGYVKTGSLGQMIYDFEGMWRSGKKVVTMATDDKDDSLTDWAWAGADLGRRLTFLSGAWGGINSTSKAGSELAGLMQTLNAMANTVRPLIQAERNDEKRTKAYRKKVEKGLAQARKATREREKQVRDAEEAEKKAEREKREKAKRREEQLKRM